MGTFNKSIGDSFRKSFGGKGTYTPGEGLLLSDPVVETPTRRSGGRSSGGRSSSGSSGTSSAPAAKSSPKNSDKDSFTEWMIKKGLDLAYDEYGKPIIREEVFDLYMSEVAGATAVEKDGKKYYVDENGKQITDANSYAAAKAASAATSAGLESLWNAYLKNGTITSKDYTAAAAKSAFAGGQSYSSDWLKNSGNNTPGWSGAHAGGWAGAGSVAADLLAGEDVKYDRAALAAASAGGKEYLTETAAQGGGDARGAGAMGSALASIGSYFYGRSKAGTYGEKQRAGGAAPFLSMMGGVAGGTLFGPAGGLVGGMAGGLVGGMRDRPKDKYVYTYAGNNQPYVFNQKTGQFEPNQVIGVRRYSVQNGVAKPIGFTDGEPPETWIQGQQERVERDTEQLNKKLKNFDNLSVVDQLSLYDAMEGKLQPTTYRNEQGEVIDAEVRINPNIGTEHAYNQLERNLSHSRPENWDLMSYEDQQKWQEGLHGKPLEQDSIKDGQLTPDAYAKMVEDRVKQGGQVSPQMREFLDLYNQGRQASEQSIRQYGWDQTDPDQRRDTADLIDPDKVYRVGESVDNYTLNAEQRQRELNDYVYGAGNSANPNWDYGSY